MSTTGSPLDITEMAAGELYPHVTFNAAMARLNLSFRSVRLTHSANQAIVTATSTAVLFNTEIFDDGLHSTSSNTDRIVPLETGRYVFGARVQWEGSAAGTLRQITLARYNAAGAVQDHFDSAGIVPNAIAGIQRMIVGGMTEITTVGDYVRLLAFHDAGTNKNLESSVATYGAGFNFSPMIWAHKVG